MGRRFLEIGPELAHVSKGKPPPRIGPKWELLDVAKRPGIDIVGTWGEWSGQGENVKPLPVKAGTYDHVYASHVLEHVWWWLAVPALRDIFRILRPGGRCEMWVPNGDVVMGAFNRQECGDGWRRHNKAGDWMAWFNGRMFTYGPGADNTHRAIFTEAWLQSRFEAAGFVNCFRPEKPTGRDNHGKINLGMIGIRP